MSTEYHCEYCGSRFTSVFALTSQRCSRHPDGVSKGRHKLFEGQPASRYVCKHCGQSFSSLFALTGQRCSRHPSGTNKAPHSPALRA